VRHLVTGRARSFSRSLAALLKTTPTFTRSYRHLKTHRREQKEVIRSAPQGSWQLLPLATSCSASSSYLLRPNEFGLSSFYRMADDTAPSVSLSLSNISDTTSGTTSPQASPKSGRSSATKGDVHLTLPVRHLGLARDSSVQDLSVIVASGTIGRGSRKPRAMYGLISFTLSVILLSPCVVLSCANRNFDASALLPGAGFQPQSDAEKAFYLDIIRK
jgi:hypothetical protein